MQCLSRDFEAAARLDEIFQVQSKKPFVVLRKKVLCCGDCNIETILDAHASCQLENREEISITKIVEALHHYHQLCCFSEQIYDFHLGRSNSEPYGS